MHYPTADDREQRQVLIDCLMPLIESYRQSSQSLGCDQLVGQAFGMAGTELPDLEERIFAATAVDQVNKAYFVLAWNDTKTASWANARKTANTVAGPIAKRRVGDSYFQALRDVAASAIMPSLAKRLRMIAPEVRVQCHQVDHHEIPTELAAGRLDFAIDISALARTELDSVALMSDRLVCALRKHHPRVRKRVSVKDVLSLSHVTVSNRRAGRTLAEEAMSRAGGDLKTVMRLPHYQPAFHVIVSTDLALLAPLSLARRYDVSICALGFTPTRLELLLVWRRDSADDPALLWARGEIVNAGQANSREDKRRPRTSRPGASPARS